MPQTSFKEHLQVVGGRLPNHPERMVAAIFNVGHGGMGLNLGGKLIASPVDQGPPLENGHVVKSGIFSIDWPCSRCAIVGKGVQFDGNGRAAKRPIRESDGVAVFAHQEISNVP